MVAVKMRLVKYEVVSNKVKMLYVPDKAFKHFNTLMLNIIMF